MKPRRDATRIICEILKICKEGATKTRIVYNANLNSLLVGQYVAALARRGLLFNTSADDPAIFATTEAGEELLAVLVEAEKRMIGLASTLDEEETEKPVLV